MIAGDRWTCDALADLLGGARVTCWDADARVVPAPGVLRGRPGAPIFAQRWHDLVERTYADDRGELVLAWLGSRRRPGVPTQASFRYARAGGWVSVDITFLNLLDVPAFGVIAAVQHDERPVEPPPPITFVDDGVPPSHAWHLLHLDELGRVQSAEGFSSLTLGRPIADVVGCDSSSWVHPDDLDKAVATWIDVLGGPGETRTLVCRTVRPDGTERWTENIITNRLHEPGVAAVVSLGYDIEERRRREAALRASEQQFRALAEEIAVAVFRADADGIVTYANDLFRQLLGEVRRLHNLSEPASEWWDAVLASRRSVEAHIDIGDRVLRIRGRAQHEDCEGEVPCMCAVLTIVGSVEDVTEVVTRERRLDQLAHSDPLTGLANRRVLETTLRRAIDRGEPVLVLSMDLDGFKALNDEAGHHAGDQALVEIASRLRSVVRPSDLVARLGGDEFVLVCRAVADTAVDDLVVRVRAIVAEPLGERRDRHLFVSVGTTRTQPGDDADSVLRRADLRMYEDKRTRAATSH